MKHASLFSGIGGPEVAASMLGWENVFHCEINPFGRAVLDYWFPNSESYEDITKTDFTKYRGQIDVLTGGFPCQPFSYAGKREGQADDRYLWPEMLRVIDEVRPTWVIGENVAGITTMVESCEVTDMGGEATLFEEGEGLHRYRSEHTFTVERICRDLESKGYSVQPVLIPACAVGAPHRRDRVFIIAYSAGCRSESYSQNGGTEGDGGRKYAQQGEWSEQTEFNNGFLELSRNAADSKDLLINGGQTRYGGDGIGQEVPQLGGRDSEDAPHTDSKRLQKRMWTRLCENTEEERARVDNRTERFGYDGRPTGMLPGERWKGFPTVSAVHRGNDGLPFDVDDLAIPFVKWRNESLKAYGNAIVPQVMYRIFQIIDNIAKA